MCGRGRFEEPLVLILKNLLTMLVARTIRKAEKRDSPIRIADKIILFVTDDYNTLISQAHTGLIQVGHSAYVLNRPEDEP